MTKEGAIRDLIRMAKSKIKYYKYHINTTYKYDEETKKEYLMYIRHKKMIIKYLKKQLPTPIDTHDWGVRVVNYCGVCGVSCITWHKYCPRCGQKLRW